MKSLRSFACMAALTVVLCGGTAAYADEQHSEVIGDNVYSYHLSRWGAVIDSINVNDPNGVVEIPERLGGETTDRVMAGAFGYDKDKVTGLIIKCDAEKMNFSDLKNLESVRFENTATIGKACFSGCVSLRDVSISDTVLKIDTGAFENCTSLISITIPDTVEVIGEEAFSGCAALANVKWSMKDIVGFNVFKGTKYLSDQDGGLLILNNGKSLYCVDDDVKTVDIPEGITYIYQFAFENTDVETITVPKTINVIDQNAFNGARKLKEIRFKGDINKFEPAAFQDCSSLTEFTIPDGITEIPELCFSGCTSLRHMDMPDNIKEIGDYAFQSCSSLETVSFSKSLELIQPDAFERCSTLKEVSLPETVTRIGERTFNECKNLSILKIPGKTTIEDAAFCNTALTESNITLGIGVVYTAVEKNKKYENDPLVFLYKDNNGTAEPIYSTPKPRTTDDSTAEVRVTAKPEVAEKTTDILKQTEQPIAETLVKTIDVISGTEVSVAVNGSAVEFPDAKPYIDENDRTQIPIRAVAEALNCDVAWDNDTRTVTITYGDKTVYVTIGEDKLRVGDKTVQMDTTAEIKEDRTYIPVRFVGEALGADVNWIE